MQSDHLSLTFPQLFTLLAIQLAFMLFVIVTCGELARRHILGITRSEDCCKPRPCNWPRSAWWGVRAGWGGRSQGWSAVVWAIGALFAWGHSVGALVYFHHGSQREAMAAIARETQEILGFPFGFGLYVNYLFLVVWGLDAALALYAPRWHRGFGQRYHQFVLGFLAFIFFNGTVVFKGGWVRTLGLVGFSLILVVSLVSWRKRKSS